MASKRGRLVSSLASGLAFALLTWLMIGDHPSFDLLGSRFEWLAMGLFIFVIPGIFAGPIVSGNVHVVDAWVASLANFLFYFGLVYLGGTLWQKRKAKAEGPNTLPPPETDRTEPK